MRTISQELKSLSRLLISSALIILFLILLPLQIVTSRENLKRELGTVATFLSNTGRAAFAFEDEDALVRFASAMSTISTVELVNLNGRKGQILGRYERSSKRSPYTRPFPYNFLPNLSVEVDQPVTLDNKVIGTVHIRSNDISIYRDSALFCGLFILLFGVSGLLTLILRRRLQQRIVAPLSGLATTIEEVGSSRNYSLRTFSKEASSEIQTLMQGFNQMLEEIGNQSERLKHEKDKAEEALAIKSQFLANMSHELRTPLNGILGMNQLLLDGELPQEIRECVELSHESAHSLYHIVEDLLEMTRIEAGKIELRPTPTHLVQLIERLIAALSINAKQKSVKISYSVPRDIPKLLLIDPDRVRQILLNLVHNAIKFTPEGGSVELRCQFERTEDHELNLKFEVSDSGIGIPPNRLKEIFKDFYQIDSGDSRLYGGLGLGLAISKHLTSLMGGDISVTSTLGHGSTFTVTIPTLEADSSGLPSEELESIFARHLPEERLSEPEPNRVTVRALVVDDHFTSLLLLEKILQRRGFEVSTARGGHEALQLLGEHVYDVVLMDCRMPGLDGFSTVEEFRKRERLKGDRRTPIIAVTAYALEGDKQRCLDAGMDGFTAKPVSPDALFDEISRFISLDFLEKQLTSIERQIQ